MSRYWRIAGALVLIVGTIAGLGAQAKGRPLVGVLERGTAVFWKGGRVGAVTNGLAGDASCARPCFTYRLRLAEEGARLRVAIDVPQRNDSFGLNVVSPSGISTEVVNINAFNAEAFVPKPALGTWTITVTPLTAEYSTFQLRAKLEVRKYSPPRTAELWLPNLMVPRLWEFGFVAPVSGIAGFSMDDANPPLDAAGMHPFSCTVDEMEAGAQRCLRFSFQMANAGDGNFDVRFNTSANAMIGKMVQCIQRPSGSPIARDAGEFDFHAVHAHYHYKDVIAHSLFRVTDRETGAMNLVGVGEKTGYHPADQSFAEWDRIVQAPTGTSADAGNCFPDSNQQIGLSRGWGDAYRWQRPGNFVEFGDNPDGWYVVRTVADPLDHLLESDETDNAGYAYIRVVGDSVRLLEQGRGLSPWDPHKVVNRY